jgi:hypothetical protein
MFFARHLFVIAGLVLVSLFGSQRIAGLCASSDTSGSSCCSMPVNDESCCDPVQKIEDCSCDVQAISAGEVFLKLPVQVYGPALASMEKTFPSFSVAAVFAHDSSPPDPALPLFLFHSSLLI